MRPSLLAIFAHPDDEAFTSGGTLAHYARLGVDVHLICLTRGEVGKINDPALGHVTDVGTLREGELQEACRHMGIHPPIFLDYHDSGRGDRLQHHNPKASINADLLEIEGKILDVIQKVQPQVLITFDPHGGYGHPDHLVIQRATLGAFFRSGTVSDQVCRLFYTARSAESWKRILGSNPRISSEGLDPDIYGVSEATLAVRMQVQAYAEQKMAAILAHRSQTGPQSAFAQRQAEIAASGWLTQESFSLGGVRGTIPHYPLHGLFDGLNFQDLV